MYNVSTCVMSVLFNCSGPVLMRCNFPIVYGLKTAWKIRTNRTDWKTVSPPRFVKMCKQTENFFKDMSNLMDWQAFFFNRIGLFILHNPLFFFQFPPSWLISFRTSVECDQSCSILAFTFPTNVHKSRERTVWINRTKPSEKSMELHSFRVTPSSTVLRLARQSQLKFYCEIVF